MNQKNVPLVHYGPIWSQSVRDKHAASWAVCAPPGPVMLTTHKPWVTCPKCKASPEFLNAV